MATTPTNNAVPSESPRDLKFNAGKIDEFVNQMAPNFKYTDRFGNEHLTIAGIENLVRQIVSSLGFVPFGTFEAGATLTDATQTLKYEEDGNYYRWDGVFPKDVPSSSTPDGTGGVAQGAWVNVTDLTLRSELASNEIGGGGSLVKLEQGGDVQDLANDYYHRVNYYTPEMFGAVGNGISDDYPAIQSMFDNIPSGSAVHFDGSKTYYNAFSASGTAGSITISKPVTVFFNNAKLTRLPPRQSSDDQSSLIFINNVDGVVLHALNLDGNNPTGAPYNNSGVPVVTTKITSLCQAIDYGVYCLDSKNISISGMITKCAFNIWVKNSHSVKVNANLTFGGQVITKITPTDLAYGAGIKLSDSSYFNIVAEGYGNSNATVEIEPGCNHGFVEGQDVDNLSSGITIGDSSDIQFKYKSKNCSTGLQIFQTSSTDSSRQTARISGDMMSQNCTWGASIHSRSGSSRVVDQISIKLSSKSCPERGLYLLNQGGAPIYVNIDYNGVDTASATSGNDVVISGDVRGRITGSSRGCYNGVLTTGSNSEVGISIAMDLQEVASVAYAQGASTVVDWTGTKTSTEYKILPNVKSIRIERSNVSGATQAFGDIAIRANNWYFRGIPVTGAFANAVYRVPSEDNSLKLFNPNN